MNEQDVRYQGWRVAAASSAATFFSSFLVYTFAVFLKPLTTEFGWSRELVASAYGIMGITAAVAAPAFGYVLDRAGVRRVVLPCMAALGIGFVSLSFLTALSRHFYAIYLLFGVVGAGLSPTGYALAISGWFVKRRGLAIGIVISGSAIAAMVQPPITQALIDRIGWRGAYVVIGLSILVIGCPILALFVRERPAAASAREVAEGASLREGLRSRAYWTLVVVFFASTVATNGVVVHLVALLSDRGVTANRAALVVSTMGVASLAGRLVSGWLADHLFAPRVSFAMLSLTALGTYLLATADSFASGALAVTLIGFGMGGEFDLTPYMVSRYFGLRAFGTLYGIAFAAAAASAAIGPVLLGRAFDETGSYGSLLPKLALCVWTATLLMLTLPRYELRTAAQSVGARGN